MQEAEHAAAPTQAELCLHKPGQAGTAGRVHTSLTDQTSGCSSSASGGLLRMRRSSTSAAFLRTIGRTAPFVCTERDRMSLAPAGVAGRYNTGQLLAGSSPAGS